APPDGALPDAETLGQRLELAPLALTPRLGAPGTAVALDRGERGLRPLLPLALDQLGDRQSSELDGQWAEPAAVAAPPLRGTIEVARHVERRCGPEDPLDDPALHAHDGAVGQERVDEHPVATDRVRAEDQRQAGPPLAPDEGEPAGLGLGDAPFAPAPAPAERLAPGLRLLTRAPVAPDAREVAARRRGLRAPPSGSARCATAHGSRGRFAW